MILVLYLCCFATLLNYYFQVSFNSNVFLYLNLLWLLNLQSWLYSACYFIFRWQEVVCGFLSEALAGSHTAVHTIFYEVDDEDGLIAIPGKYADRGQTAEYLKQMARAVNGRFHWYRSGGES